MIRVENIAALSAVADVGEREERFFITRLQIQINEICLNIVQVIKGTFAGTDA